MQATIVAVTREKLESLKKLLIRKSVADFAMTIGFDLVGFTNAKIEEKYLKAFDKWLKDGNEGTMGYMKKIEKRQNLDKILPGAKSVIVLATNYYREQKPLRKGYGRIARYAHGRDYHKIIGKNLKKLEKFINEDIAEKFGLRTIETKAYIDTGPVLERALAEQAGLGRIGKNSCLMTKEFGSWVFLAEIITTIDLTEEGGGRSGMSIDNRADRWSNPSEKTGRHATPIDNRADRWSNPSEKSFNVCANCTRCISACPTGAIIASGVIDARLCVSYLTIENKDKIPPKLAKIIQKTKRLYGCDICQEVCPHNKARQKPTSQKELSRPEIAGSQLELNEINAIKSDSQFLKTFAGSPLMRAKKEGLQQNAKTLAEKSTC